MEQDFFMLIYYILDVATIYNTSYNILDESICEPIYEPICGSNSSIIENSLKTNCNKEVQTHNSYTNELKLRRKIKLLQQKLRRTKTKVHNLEDLIDSLKNDGHIDSEQQNVIINNFNGIYNLSFYNLISYALLSKSLFLNYILLISVGNVFELFKNESKNHDKTTGRIYTQEMKEFALTLHYYSPKAYNYCRLLNLHKLYRNRLFTIIEPQNALLHACIESSSFLLSLLYFSTVISS